MCRVYLAGPITGMTFEQCTTWRVEAYKFLKTVGIEAYDPLRGKGELANIKKKIAMDAESSLAGPLNTSRAIMVRDYQDCINANALLVNLLGSSKFSMGTVMEMAWAYHCRIPVIVICEPDSVYLKHPMVKESMDVICNTLEEGLTAVVSLLRVD